MWGGGGGREKGFGGERLKGRKNLGGKGQEKGDQDAEVWKGGIWGEGGLERKMGG